LYDITPCSDDKISSSSFHVVRLCGERVSQIADVNFQDGFVAPELNELGGYVGDEIQRALGLGVCIVISGGSQKKYHTRRKISKK
jgi:hypothetical protein